VSYAIYALTQKVDMASRQRYFDAAFLVGRSLWIFYPYDPDTIRTLLNAVAAHEKNVSDSRRLGISIANHDE